MRARVGTVGYFSVVVAGCVLATFSGCAEQTSKQARTLEALKNAPARETFIPSPVPTVPPPGSVTPTQVKAATPQRKAKPGESIGPVITFLGISRADGKIVPPTSVDKQGVETYTSFVGSGFQLVVEAKPGLSGVDVARRLFASAPTDPTLRADLEIEVDKPLGNGSTEVCDKSRPKIGGVPAIQPPTFAETQEVADAINDLACRFEVFIESESSCTLDKTEDWAFRNPDTQVQFCMMVAKSWNFPVGETLVSVRMRDRAGNPGPVKRMRLSRPKQGPTPQAQPTVVPTPKQLPTR